MLLFPLTLIFSNLTVKTKALSSGTKKSSDWISVLSDASDDSDSDPDTIVHIRSVNVLARVEEKKSRIKQTIFDKIADLRASVNSYKELCFSHYLPTLDDKTEHDNMRKLKRRLMR